MTCCSRATVAFTPAISCTEAWPSTRMSKAFPSGERKYGDEASKLKGAAQGQQAGKGKGAELQRVFEQAGARAGSTPAGSDPGGSSGSAP